jgi:hypothetical protein
MWYEKRGTSRIQIRFYGEILMKNPDEKKGCRMGAAFFCKNQWILLDCAAGKES